MLENVSSKKRRSQQTFFYNWGRSAYLCSARQMEMNPLMVFQSSCLGKQSVESSLSSIPAYLGKKPKNNKCQYEQ
jgi:hypothetical protein